MEKIKRKPDSIKKSFVTAISVTLLSIFVCSAATLYGCWMIQRNLLAHSNEVWLQTKTTYTDGTVSEGKQRIQLDVPTELTTLIPAGGMPSEEKQVEYTIEKIESSYSLLSPTRKFVYRGSQIAMIIFPLFYSVIGITLCAWWFYRKKIAPPVHILTDAIAQIQQNTLDFTIVCPSNDELGQLCSMFEIMRQTLYENNRQLWRTIEDQRILQASVAHDLRNPITILEGYIEYLQKKLSDGQVTEEKLNHTLSNMSITAKRLEQYTDCMRDLNALQKVEVNPSYLIYPDGLNQIVESISMILKPKNIKVKTIFHGDSRTIYVDQVLIARILENVFANAVRYAKTTVHVSSLTENGALSICIQDDGPGFSPVILSKKSTLFYSESTKENHLGLGLATARILCQKQNGQLSLSNNKSGGASVQIFIPFQQEK